MSTVYRWPKTHAAVVAAELAEKNLDEALEADAHNSDLVPLMEATWEAWDIAAATFHDEGPSGNHLLNPNRATAHEQWLRRFAYTEVES